MMKKIASYVMLMAACGIVAVAAPAEASAGAEQKPAAVQKNVQPVVVTQGEGVAEAKAVMQPDGTLQLRLKENPSTGYTWNFMVLDNDYLEVIGDEFFLPASDNKMVGQPGLRVFTLKAVDSGTTMVKLAYYRSWEGLASRADKFVINVDIKKAE